ncbi:MAG: hypothetical protein SGBAC_003419 [Bacillariaceae sp.]
MKTGNKTGPGKNDIVFGIRKSKEMLNRFPRTMEYLNERFEQYSNQAYTSHFKSIMLESMVAQAKKWEPPAKFFRYNHDKAGVEFYPLDDKQAKEKTNETLRSMKRSIKSKAAKAIPEQASDPKNYVVFGIGNDPKMRGEFPRTIEYRELLQRNFEAHLNATKEQRVTLLENVVAQAYDWDPPADFFKWDGGNGKIYPLDEKQVRKNTQALFKVLSATHRRREKRKLEGTAEGLEEEDDISISLNTSERHDINGGDASIRAHSSRSGHTAEEETLDDDYGEEDDKPSNNHSAEATAMQSPHNYEAHPRDKKRSFLETTGERDWLGNDLKRMEPSSTRYKLRKAFLDRTIYVDI